MGQTQKVNHLDQEDYEEIENLVKDLKEMLKDTGAENLVVHITPPFVAVDNDIKLDDNEWAIIRLGNGNDYYYIIANGTPDGDFILFKGSDKKVKRQLKKLYERYANKLIYDVDDVRDEKTYYMLYRLFSTLVKAVE